MKLSSLIALLSLLPALGRLAAADFFPKDEAEFNRIIAPDSKVQRIASGFAYATGPVWNPAEGGFLIFSDIPYNEMKKYTRFGGVTVFRKPSNYAAGNDLDAQGRLLTAEHSTRRVSVTEKDGQIKTLVDQYDGKKFNSPHNIIVKSDGTVWFSDPIFGDDKAKEQPGNYIFRFDPGTGKVAPVVKDFETPRGLCFSPDEKKFYAADGGKARHIRVFDVEQNGTLSNGRVFCDFTNGLPDGIRCDADGRLWCSAADGVYIFKPDGSSIGRIKLPETPSNLTFGGKDGKTLFITARKSLYSVQTLVTGVPRSGKAGG